MTIGGLVCQRVGAVPHAGQTITLGRHQLEVVAASERKVVEVRLRPRPSPVDS